LRSGSTFLNRGLQVLSGNRSETYKLPKYIVRGHVQDEKGNPIGGAAIRIGQEIVYTNADVISSFARRNPVFVRSGWHYLNS
jgi:hypothetical protein